MEDQVPTNRERDAGRAKVKDVRGFSDFGYPTCTSSSRTARTSTGALAHAGVLSKICRAAAGVTTEMGPDATGVGWVFQYALVDKGGMTWRSCAPFRIGTCGITCSRWRGGGSGAAGRLRAAVPGERGSQPAGGVRRADLEVVAACAAETTTWRAAGGVHGRDTWCAGGIRALDGDLENISLAVSPTGVPILVRDVER